MVLWAVVLCVAAAPTAAQLPVAPPPAPAQAPVPTPAPTPAPKYFIPDFPPNALTYDGEHVWIRPIIAIVGDYTWLSQDQASMDQVGVQESTPDLRAGRLGMLLRAKGSVAWEVFSTVDYQEPRTRDSAVFELYDLQFRLPMGPVKLIIGKQKEPISYELSGLSVLLPQQERILSPFFSTRNIGVSVTGQFAHARMTWAAGAFNDWLETGEKFGSNARDFVGRVTALAWESKSKTDYIHLGGGFRSTGPDAGLLRFSGRPETNVTDKYVDTGEFAGKRANLLSLELLWSRGPFSILAERFDTWVNAPDSGNPRFSGYYVLGSWVVTGESRPYARTLGYAAGIRPGRRSGAIELVGRYSKLDLTDGPIDGGILDKWHVGVNWWSSTQWKVGVSWGSADLNKAGLRGNTTMWLTRVQWLY
jgi:phosphate-selective porin OprO/OprP